MSKFNFPKIDSDKFFISGIIYLLIRLFNLSIFMEFSIDNFFELSHSSSKYYSLSSSEFASRGLDVELSIF